VRQNFFGALLSIFGFSISLHVAQHRGVLCQCAAVSLVLLAEELLRYSKNPAQERLGLGASV
jgi:hypothetical protein